MAMVTLKIKWAFATSLSGLPPRLVMKWVNGITNGRKIMTPKTLNRKCAKAVFLAV